MYKLNNIYIGIVVNNQDWENRGRVQVFIPHLSNTLYKGWNESGEDIKFKSFDSSVFTPDIVSRLTDVLPWAEMAAPFFGGGTGAPVNQDTYTPTPAPTFMTFGSPTYMNYGSTGGIAPSTSFPVGKNNYDLNAIVKNSNGGNSASYYNGQNVNEGVDVKNLNSTFSQRVAGFANELKSAGYDVTISSGFRAPTMSEKNAIGSTGTDQETLYKRNNGKGTAPPYKSNHGFGIATDIKISGNGKFGFVDITRIDTDLDGANETSSGLEALKQKWGLHTPVNKEKWHFEPVETGITGNGFQTANNLNNNNVPAFSGSAIAQDGTATKQEFPKLDGMNNSAGEVSNSNSELNKKNTDPNLASRRKKFLTDLQNPVTKARFYSLIEAEVGSQGPEAQLMYIESVMNRSDSRNQSLDYFGGYYPKSTTDKVSSTINPKLISKYDSLVNNAIVNGTNISNYATGNASQNVGFGFGKSKDGLTAPGQTASVENNNQLERFGVEKPDTKWWENITGRKINEIVENPQVASNKHNNLIKPTTIFQNAGNGVDSIGGAGTAMGMFSIPQVGAKAYVMFLDGNPLKPIVVGCYQEPSNVRAS